MRLLLNICSMLIQKKSPLHAEPSLIRSLVCFTVWLTRASSESNMGEIIGFWMPTMTLQLRDAVLNIMIAFVGSPSIQGDGGQISGLYHPPQLCRVSLASISRFSSSSTAPSKPLLQIDTIFRNVPSRLFTGGGLPA